MPVPALSFPEVTRITVVDENGRAFEQWGFPGVELHLQDDGRTLKIFPISEPTVTAKPK
jgi:hypothetical protein